MGRGGAALGGRGAGGWAAWSPTGRAEAPLAAAGAADPATDCGPLPGSAEAALLAVDPRGGRRADRARCEALLRTGCGCRPPPSGAPCGPGASPRSARRTGLPSGASPRSVRTWLRHEYPALAARAKAEGAEVHWADETGLSNQANYGRSFAPKGQTPVLPRPAARVSQSMISSLTNRGTLRFMVYDGALTAATFLVFLRRLVQGAKRKLFVIVDNLRVHRARQVTAWVKANAQRAELFYLPPYAPEHNPDEFLNNDVKQAMAREPVPRDKASLKAELTSYMRRLQRRPAKVRAFFQAPSVRYAA